MAIDAKQPGVGKGGAQSLSTYAAQFAPQASNLFYNNLIQWNGVPASPRQHFLDFLEHWETSIPLQSLWMVFFDIPLVVQEASLKGWGEHHINMPWGVNKIRGKLTDGTGSMYTGYGCALAQTVGIPVEQMTIDTTGPVNRGFLKAPIIQQRQAFAALNIEFLETNLSFNDFVLRPWIIIASHQGLVARQNPKERITTDIFVVNLARAGTKMEWNENSQDYNNTRGFQPRKIWLFKDCIPVNVGQERYSYTTSTQVDRRDTEWNFRKYQVITPDSFFSNMNEIDSLQNNDAYMFWNHEFKHRFKTPKDASTLNHENQTASTKFWRETIEDGLPRNSLARDIARGGRDPNRDARNYWNENKPKPSPVGESVVPEYDNVPGGRTPKKRRLRIAQGKHANDAATYWAKNDPHKKKRHQPPGNR